MSEIHTNAALPRTCPFCEAPHSDPGFPFGTRYAGSDYQYLRCSACGTSYIDPAPDAAAFEAMYATHEYHDVFYDGRGQGTYGTAVRRLAAHLPEGAKIIDYGCGTGHLIQALAEHGFDSYGTEFSEKSAGLAASRTGRTVFSVTNDEWKRESPWDCIHLGDVIEHLPNPRETLSEIVAQLRPGGWLSAEGPLETNASLVYAAIRANDWVKRRILGRHEASFVPYHLIFTDATAQRRLFQNLGMKLEEISWEISESGWPYIRNGVARHSVARAAIAASRLPVLRGRLGNRFVALYRRS